MSATKKKAPTKKAVKKAAKPSWLVGRFRNALHKTNPSLKDGKTLKGVIYLSDIRAALQVPTDEWENLLETFFNLGGKLTE